MLSISLSILTVRAFQNLLHISRPCQKTWSSLQPTERVMKELEDTLSMFYKQLCDWTTGWCISKPDGGCLSVAYFQKKNSYGGCLFLNYRLSKLWQFIEIYKNLAQYYHPFLTKQPWLMKEWRNLKRKITCNLTHQY